MKKVFLHIGTFKTGSTALQFHMHKNREALLEEGFYYGDYFDNYYLHSNLCYGLLREALGFHNLLEQYKGHPRFKNVAEKPTEVIERMKKNSLSCPNIIISCEAFFADSFRTLVGLHTQLPDETKHNVNQYMRRRLKQLLYGISEDIVIICYLRRQDLFIESQYNQYCKDKWYGDSGYTIPTFKEFIACKPIELNYFSALEEWHDIFDKAEFIIKPYEKSAFKGGLINDFYTDILKINENVVNKFEDIDRNQTNLRLDRDVLEFKKQLGIDDLAINQLLKKYSENMGEIRDYAYFDVATRKMFVESFSEQNACIATKYLNRKDRRLFVDENYNIPLYDGLQREQQWQITRWLISELIGKQK